MSDPFSGNPDETIAAHWRALLETGEIPAASSGGTRVMNDLYGPIATAKTAPFVIGQLGQSLDGNIATASGASHYVTGPESLVHLHRLRALCDAVVVGWRTVESDNPKLTVRNAEGPDPLRVVVDMAGRLDGNRRAFDETWPGSLRIRAEGTPDLSGVESIAIPSEDGRAAPRDIVAALEKRGCRRILVEGGGALVSAFLKAGHLDRLHVTVAPLITGEGRPGLALPGVETLDKALRPHSRHYFMGQDVLFDLDLTERETPAA